MTQSFDFMPDGDEENDGWTLVGPDVDFFWEALSYPWGDDCYCYPPAYRGGLSVKFPVDVGDLPEGAIIDSVTIWIRMRTKNGSGPRSVTVNVLSRLNRSRYTTRSLYATSTFQDYEVGTYTRDPLGHKWDMYRLNQLRLRVFSYNNVNRSVEISGLWAQVNYHLRPSVTVTGPTGTVNTPSPVISWNYEHEEGEPQQKAEYRIWTADEVAKNSFNPNDTEEVVYSAEVDGEESSYTLPTSLNADDYYVYVRVWSQFGAKSAWDRKAFTVQGPSPGIPGDDNAGVSGLPGVGVPTVVADSYTSSASITMRDSSNLMSVNQADFEIATDPLEWVGENAVLARDTTTHYGGGVASMSLSASDTADMRAVSTLIEVMPETPLTFRGQVRAATVARTNVLKCRFYDDSFASIGTEATASGVSSTSTWTELVGNHNVPVGARYAEVELEVQGPAAGEVHYADHMGLMYGVDTAWSDGGHVSTNLLTSFLATGDDPAPASDAWAPANIGTTVQRVATTGTGAHGLKANQMTAAAVSGTIAYRATSTVWSSPTMGTNFSLNKPASLADNDLMVAFVTANADTTVERVPAGWKHVNSARVTEAAFLSLHVFKRTGVAADPTSWTDGVLSGECDRRSSVVVAYSGAAHADDQFIAENVKADAGGSLVHQTQTVHNDDPNAWRLSAFAANDNVSGGTFTANVDPPDNPAGISYVGKASWKTESYTTGFKLYKPSDAVAGDLLIGAVSFSGYIDPPAVPAGWTEVETLRKWVNGGDERSGSITTMIMKRTLQSGDPSSWEGTNESTTPIVSHVVAYRGCADAADQFIDTEFNTEANRAYISTGSAYNTDSDAWRVSVFAATTPYGDSWRHGDNRTRANDTTSKNNSPDVVLAVFDSNHSVSTGNHSQYAELDGWDSWAETAWLGLIKPQATPPPQGDDETARVNNTNGSSDPWVTLSVHDSNGVAATGDQSVYGVFTPSSGNGAGAVDSWIGLIKPADSTQAGFVEAYTNTEIDIASLDSRVLDLCGGKITYVASFLGSTAGQPTLTLDFYRANQLIETLVADGSPFNESVWQKSWAVFDIPEGTTRIRPRVGAIDRAVGDTVLFDRIGVMLGDVPDGGEGVWRNGTARPEHPVWSAPYIERSDDDGTGYGPWERLDGQVVNPPQYTLLANDLVYVDHTIIPLHNRRYRVQTLSYGLNGDKFASGFGPASNEAAFSALNWWIKDLQNLDSNMQLKVKAEPVQVGTTNTAASFQPLGEQYPVVISEGYKADTVELILIMKRDEFAEFKRLIANRRTLLLQSDYDYSWWVRPLGDLEVTTQVTAKRKTDPIRFVKVTFVQVAPEE